MSRIYIVFKRADTVFGFGEVRMHEAYLDRKTARARAKELDKNGTRNMYWCESKKISDWKQSQ